MTLLTSRPRTSLVLIGLAVLGLLIYADAIFHPFVHDDVVFIQLNPNIARWDNIGESFLTPGVPLPGLRISTPYYRPVLEIFYRAEHALFGMDPHGFHLFNILLHVLNSGLVFFAVRFWGLRRDWALGVAVLFLVHPVQSEAVACVSGISNLAVALPLLLSFVLYAKARRTKGKNGVFGLIGAGLAFVAALFTKEQAVVFPAFLLLYELLRPRGQKGMNVLPSIAFFGLAAGYFLWRAHLFPDHLNAAFENGSELCLRILAIPRTVLMYLGLIVCPVGLHYYRNGDILSPPGLAWGALTIVCGSIAYAIIRMPRRRKRPVLLGLAWGALFLVPGLNIVPLINEYSLILTAEHFLYLSLAGFLVALAGLAVPWVREFPRKVWAVPVAVVVAVLCIVTIWQNTFWRAEVPLFERMVRFEPHFGRGHFLLAKAYLDQRKFPEAAFEYTKALGIMEGYLKKTRDPKVRMVYGLYVKAGHRDLGQVRLIQGDLAASSADFRKSLAVRLDGVTLSESGVDDSQTANNLALNLLRMGRRNDARRWWQIALKLDARNADVINNLGMMALERGDKHAAIFYFSRLLKIVPGNMLAARNLAKAEQLK